MTTIVYDHKRKQIAIDSRCTGNKIIKTDSDIKYRYSGAVLFFCCGDVSDHELLIEAYNGADIKECNSFAFAVVDGNVKLCGVADGRFWIENVKYNAALGSGGDFALASIDHGKTAKEAVEYALTRDYCSGGIIHVYDIASAKFIE